MMALAIHRGNPPPSDPGETVDFHTPSLRYLTQEFWLTSIVQVSLDRYYMQLYKQSATFMASPLFLLRRHSWTLGLLKLSK